MFPEKSSLQKTPAFEEMSLSLLPLEIARWADPPTAEWARKGVRQNWGVRGGMKSGGGEPAGAGVSQQSTDREPRVTPPLAAISKCRVDDGEPPFTVSPLATL